MVGLPLIVADGYLTASTGARLGETLAPRDPKRALDVAETALEVARAGGFRALEAELLRVKASALLSLGVEVAEAAANEGYELAQQLGLGPEDRARAGAAYLRHHGDAGAHYHQPHIRHVQ